MIINKKRSKETTKKLLNKDKKKFYAFFEHDNKLFASKNEIKKIVNSNKKHNGPKNVKNSENYIIELSNVYKTFTNGYIVNNVLKDINLKVRKGDFVVILGSSGSGKTTLMNILSGLSRASEGETIICDTNTINLSNGELTDFRRKNVGYIFQEYGLLNTLSVYENILAGYNLNKKDNDKSIINDVIKMIGLEKYRNKFPYELSGGQQQRVAIARAIAKNPKIIFGDEPTGAVDSEMSKIILDLLKKINKEKGTTIVIITHDKEVAKLADIVFHIVGGSIVCEGNNYNQ